MWYCFQEEKAEIKAQNYLLEKEKKALELRLSGKESREQAYLVQIEHLKSEVLEQSTRGSRDSSPFPARVGRHCNLHPNSEQTRECLPPDQRVSGSNSTTAGVLSLTHLPIFLINTQEVVALS